MSSGKLLIVDDEESLLVTMQAVLEMDGYEVATTPRGLDAVELLRERTFDLVMTDLRLVDIDGLTVLAEVRRQAPETVAIMLTGYASLDSAVKALREGAYDYLTKPLDVEELRATVARGLERRELVLALRERLRDLQAANYTIAQLNADLERRVDAATAELRELNRTLDARVQEQVAELERVGRLRRYLPAQLARLISSGDEKLLESHRRQITVVFCELRGFSEYADSAEPEDVIDLLTDYHRELGLLVDQYEGTLQRFSGDALMVFFNDPTHCADPQATAVSMALQMQERVRGLKDGWADRLGTASRLGLRIGIDHGYATLGRVGYEGRFDYAAIGGVTARAARLCAAARDDQILVSQRVHAVIRERVDSRPIGDLRIKGLRDPVLAYDIVGPRAQGLHSSAVGVVPGELGDQDVAHRVFISHASEDAVLGEHLCQALEFRGVRCWMAPRDLVPGQVWPEALIRAVESSRLLILLLSAAADSSRRVLAEVEAAASKGIPILTLQIGGVRPSQALQFYVTTSQWLDISDPLDEPHQRAFVGAVEWLLEQKQDEERLSTTPSR